MKDKLTVTMVSKTRPGQKVKVLSDGAGLRLLIHPNGSKYWQLRFTISGRESSMQLGQYPEMSLAQARVARDKSRTDVKTGQSPVIKRRIEKADRQKAEIETFKAVANAWLLHGQEHPNKRTRRVWSLTHVQRNENLLNNYLLKDLGGFPIQDITEDYLRSTIERSYRSGKRESARRAAAVASQVFSFAKEKGLFKGHNPAAELLNYSTLAKPEVKHFAALKADQVGPMLRKLADSQCHPVTKAGLILMLYTGLRDFSLRGAQWKEIDIENALWTVPASRMKRSVSHVVPLPTQAISTLHTLKPFTYRGGNSFVFASEASKYGFIAENSLRLALHGIGFKVTAHGLRSLLTDVLNENSFNRDAIERQLDHVENNKVRSAYLRSDFMTQRTSMMQWWADWCDAQIVGSDQPPLPNNAADAPSAKQMENQAKTTRKRKPS